MLSYSAINLNQLQIFALCFQPLFPTQTLRVTQNVSRFSASFRSQCRLMDRVIIRGSPAPMELYCVDLDYMTLEVDFTERPKVPWNTRQRFKVWERAGFKMVNCDVSWGVYEVDVFLFLVSTQFLPLGQRRSEYVLYLSCWIVHGHLQPWLSLTTVWQAPKFWAIPKLSCTGATVDGTGKECSASKGPHAGSDHRFPFFFLTHFDI